MTAAVSHAYGRRYADVVNPGTAVVGVGGRSWLSGQRRPPFDASEIALFVDLFEAAGRRTLEPDDPRVIALATRLWTTADSVHMTLDNLVALEHGGRAPRHTARLFCDEMRRRGQEVAP